MIILGIIIGLLISIIVMTSTRRYQTPIERIVKKVENLTKEKGEIFIESDEAKELGDMLDNLPNE